MGRSTQEEPLCIKVDTQTVETKMVEIMRCYKEHALVQINESYWIGADDILSVQVYDEENFIRNEPVTNIKPPKRRLNEG